MNLMDFFTAGGNRVYDKLFGGDNSYDDAIKQYQEYTKKAEQTQNPFIQSGQGGMSNFQDWLNQRKDPGDFINKIMGGYQESPWAKYMRDQATKAGINSGSATGMIGSTPWAQQMQENASGIASKDMENWLKNVLGISESYGEGQKTLMKGGQDASQILANLYGNMGGRMAEAAYGKKETDKSDMMGNIATIAKLAALFM